jgi:hypothetical protein
MSRRSRTSQQYCLLVIVATCLGTLLFPGAVCAQEAASAGSGARAYDVPVPDWVAKVATELKKEFLAGVAQQAVDLEEARAAGDLRLLVDAADRLVADGDAIDKAMDSMGRVDSSFGIPGVSRLVTAEGAIRDTLFGFVVWHEMAAGESRTLATDLEASVKRLTGLSRAVDRNVRQLSSNADRVRSALKTEDYESIANSSEVVSEATAEIDVISAEIDAVAARLETLVWTVQEGGGALLEAEWQQVLLAVSDSRRLALKVRPALVSLREGSTVSEAMSRALGGAVEVISLMDAARAGGSGALYFPSAVFDLDTDVVKGLEDDILGGSATGFSEDQLSALESLMAKVVAADRILAERAVEYTSTEVGRSMDRLESHYETTSDYDPSASARDQERALEKVDVALRRNEDAQAARTSARAARAALDDGKSKEGQGSTPCSQLLTQYRNAWVHALNAGESAAKATSRVNRR